MSLYQDTKKSYYKILAEKLLSNNRNFTVLGLNSGRCFTPKHTYQYDQFIKWADRTAKKLKNESGNIIQIDNSIFSNFPPTRPTDCLPAGVRISKEYYFDKKKNEYYILKEKIDKKLELLKEKEGKEKQKISIQVNKQEDMKKLSGIGITAILAYFALKK